MNTLRLGLRQNQTTFVPGEAIAGAAQWELESPAQSGEIRFFWYTMGKGTQDFGVVEKVEIAAPGVAGVQEFSFTAPRQPYSFSGQNLSVAWAIELLLPPLPQHERAELIIAPERREIVLPRLIP